MDHANIPRQSPRRKLSRELNKLICEQFALDGGWLSRGGLGIDIGSADLNYEPTADELYECSLEKSGHDLLAGLDALDRWRHALVTRDTSAIYQYSTASADLIGAFDDPYVALHHLTHSRLPDERAELDALKRELNALITGDRSAFPSVYSCPFSIGAADLSREPTAEEMYECSDEKHIYDLEHRISALRAERATRRKLQHAPALARHALRRPGRRSQRARRTRRVARTAAKGADPPGEPRGPRRPSSTTEIRRTRAARANWSAR